MQRSRIINCIKKERLDGDFNWLCKTFCEYLDWLNGSSLSGFLAIG